MSRQPRLNTSLRQQVYSYVETPIEMSPPGFPSHSTDITTDQTTAYKDQSSTSDTNQQGSLQTDPDRMNVASQELEQARQQRLQERQALALTAILTWSTSREKTSSLRVYIPSKDVHHPRYQSSTISTFASSSSNGHVPIYQSRITTCA